MRQYETAFLITPQLPEEESEKLVQKMADIVAKKKGRMINIEKWGKRKLAYPINNQEEAVYVFFQFEGEPDIPAELERKFRQTEPVIRYLTLRKDFQREPMKGTKERGEKTAEPEEVESGREEQETSSEEKSKQEK